MPLTIPFDNRYARLPERLHARASPTPVRGPGLICVNDDLARTLGIEPDELRAVDGVRMLAGNLVPDGAEPIALAYAGHQFGHFVPQLGDGRAILMGEVVGRDGVVRDLQWKGAGRTPFSRGGDGRAALGPVLREFLVSEAMAALGVPTTRALGAATTGEFVLRETPLPGAVLIRVAASHLRVGTFQFFAARGDVEALGVLADHAARRHYPETLAADHPRRALLAAIVSRQAELVARWMGLGFIHGVMNTDNCAISGETLDYGPCAFMDAYHPAKVFSFIDRQGRYAYGNQPRMAAWNLARLAEAMLPLLGDDEPAQIAAAQEALDGFARAFETAYRRGFGAKLGLVVAREEDDALFETLLRAMADAGVDFTNTFRSLATLVESDAGDAALRERFGAAAIADWLPRWRARLAEEPGTPRERAATMQAANPAFIPRNHRVEAVIQAATAGDLAPFEELRAVLAAPYDDQPAFAHYAAEPRPEERVANTFCGT